MSDRDKLDTKIGGGLSASDREILAAIRDPKVRAHYEAQLRMAHEWDGAQTAGGIFDTGGASGRTILTGMHENIDPERWVPAQPTPAPITRATERAMWGNPELRRAEVGAAVWRGIALVLIAVAIVFVLMHFTGRRP